MKFEWTPPSEFILTNQVDTTQYNNPYHINIVFKPFSSPINTIIIDTTGSSYGQCLYPLFSRIVVMVNGTDVFFDKSYTDGQMPTNITLRLTQSISYQNTNNVSILLYRGICKTATPVIRRITFTTATTKKTKTLSDQYIYIILALIIFFLFIIILIFTLS